MIINIKLHTLKAFNKLLRRLAKSYAEESICKVTNAAETDRNSFWRLLKRSKEKGNLTISAIKNKFGKVVHSVDEVLDAWKVHFSNLCTTRSLPHYDEQFRRRVCEDVELWSSLDDEDDFSSVSFSKKEIRDALNRLNYGRTPGCDGITKEHLIAAGEGIVEFLFLVLTWMHTIEYIPENFRRGIQVPLYKGKNTSTTDPNNYRGITLLTTYNKIYEILLWNRMEKWWGQINAVSQTQGACKKGVSSLHTALLLQETISHNLELGRKVFVTYLDVSKAFDRVWVEGLFYQLYNIGIKGKTWRMLYKCYKGFLCRVKKVSEWYEMSCGIHQGGFLSLVKYTAFINTLFVTLQDSGLCCALTRLKTSPLGYADDVAAASTSKNNTDRILSIGQLHSCKWRYDLNADKSAVLVYGETAAQNRNNIQYRQYRLGSEKVPERTNYDHVGIKNCNGGVYTERTVNKISKSQKALSAASALGIKRGGLSMKACNIIYWSLIIPILTYGAELWVLKLSDIEALDKYQRYAGKRIQRFPKYTPNESSFRGLGWMRFENLHICQEINLC